MSEHDHSADDAQRRDPADDPRACSLCGVHIGAFGGEYCDGCALDIGAKPSLRRCENCGTRGPENRMTAVDISTEDDYYPEIIYFCRGCADGGEQ